MANIVTMIIKSQAKSINKKFLNDDEIILINADSTTNNPPIKDKVYCHKLLFFKASQKFATTTINAKITFGQCPTIITSHIATVATPNSKVINRFLNQEGAGEMIDVSFGAIKKKASHAIP